MELEYFEVRPAKVSDADAISTVIVESTEGLKDVDFQDNGWEVFLEQVRPTKVTERVKDSRYHIFVATVNETIVGMIAVKNHSRIYQFFVHPAYSRRGIGRALWDSARHLCISENESKTIDVNSSSYAVPIYLKFGFEQTGGAQVNNGCISIPLSYRTDQQ